jgi:PII-like signaling protein
MNIPENAVLLRIFIGESDKFRGRPLDEAIVLQARERHLAGATVLRGPIGFGGASRLHTAKILRLSTDLPMVTEIVDSEDKIEDFLPILDGMMESGLVTLEKVKVQRYRHLTQRWPAPCQPTVRTSLPLRGGAPALCLTLALLPPEGVIRSHASCQSR